MSDYASSIQAVAFRVVKLALDGSPLVGDDTAYVTSQFTRVSFTPEYEEGEETKEKAADGSICVYYKMPDTLTRVNLELAICNPQPELYELLAGGSIFEGGGEDHTVTNKALASNVATLTIGAHDLEVGDKITVAGVDATFNGTYTITAVAATTVSYAKTAADVVATASAGTVTGPVEPIGWGGPAVGTEGNPNGVGLEVWSKAIVGGRSAATLPYWRWVFPSAKLRMDGERALENGPMAHAFSGWSVGNPMFGDGPGDDWDLPADSAMQYARDASAPTGVNSYVPVI